MIMRPLALSLLGFAFWALLPVIGQANPTPDVPTVVPVALGADATAPTPLPAQRVFAKNTISAQPSSRRSRRSRRRSRTPIPEDVPPGTPIAGEYIVVYKEDVTNAQAAATETSATAQAEAVASNPGPAASATSITAESATAAATPTVQVLSVTQAPPGVPSQAVIEIPPGASHERVIRKLKQSNKVLTVVPNRVVSVQSRKLLQSSPAACSPAYYAAAIRGQYAPGIALNWPNCLTGPDVALALFGDRCGTNMDRFRWTGFYAYKPATGEQIPGCVLLRSSLTDQGQISQFFGSCGVSPTLFVGLPTNVCPEAADSACVDAGSVGKYVVQTSRPLCTDPRSNQVMFQGVPCGPNNALIQWNLMSPTGCAAYSRTATDEKQQSDWLGKCGVPPFQITGVPMRICGRSVPGTPAPPPAAPTPPPTPPPAPTPTPTPTPPPSGTPGRLPSTPLASGERLDNWGMAKVGAYDSSTRTVLDARAAISSTGMKVGLIDTGAESTHPDLNIVEFMDFFDSQGSANYGRDGNGHGTHVAGIISAKNQGSGLFGVVPGMPILAMKTLGANGQGSLDGVWQAYTEVLARLQRGEKIVAINLSLGAPVSDGNTVQTECGYVSRIAAYGTAVVAAAGNDGAYLGGSIPGSCPEAMTVTSMTSSDTPSSFSNYAYSSTDPSKLNSIIAAPGSSIWSTYLNGGYQNLSGTSMATPFVTGAFAECFLAGYCKLGASPGQFSARTNNYPVVVGAAAKCGGSGSCGPSWGSSNYYGYLLNTRSWRV